MIVGGTTIYLVQNNKKKEALVNSAYKKLIPNNIDSYPELALCNKAEVRGEGFELRIDQWGALRAKQGLLLLPIRKAQQVAIILMPLKQNHNLNLV